MAHDVIFCSDKVTIVWPGELNAVSILLGGYANNTCIKFHIYSTIIVVSAKKISVEMHKVKLRFIFSFGIVIYKTILLNFIV